MGTRDRGVRRLDALDQARAQADTEHAGDV